MSTPENEAVTVSDSEIVKLHFGLKLLNESIDELSKSSTFNKLSKAERVVNDMRDLLANQTFTIHALFNEIQRIKNIGVIKNG